MNISDRNPWEAMGVGGSAIKRPEDPMLQGGFRFRNPGVPQGVPTVQDALVSMNEQMQGYKRRPAPPRPAAMNIKAELERMSPPQRAQLPDRPGPDRSAGNFISQALAGASDVFAAAGGRQGNALDKMQGLQRQQADQSYQDQLRKAAVDFENQNAGWNFQLQKLGMGQAASDREQGRYEADRGFDASMQDREAADLERELARRRQGERDTVETVRYNNLQSRLAEQDKINAEIREENRRHRTEFVEPALTHQLEAAKAKEAHDAALRPNEIKVSDFNVKQVTGGGDEAKYRELVGTRLGMSQDKRQVAESLASEVDVNDPARSLKLKIIQEGLRRSLPSTRPDGVWDGMGLWSDLAGSAPGRFASTAISLPFSLPVRAYEFFQDKLPSPEAQRQEQKEIIRRRLESGQGMWGNPPGQ